MVVGQSPKAEDIEINVCKTKKLTNTRSSSADEALKLTPPKIMSLEQSLQTRSFNPYTTSNIISHHITSLFKKES